MASSTMLTFSFILSALGACCCSLMLNLTEHLCSPLQMVPVRIKIKKMGPGLFMDSVFCYGLSVVLLQKANTLDWQLIHQIKTLKRLENKTKINCIFSQMQFSCIFDANIARKFLLCMCSPLCTIHWATGFINLSSGTYNWSMHVKDNVVS